MLLTGSRMLSEHGQDGYLVRLAGSVDEVDPGEWDAVALAAGGSIFHSHAWHATFEEAAPGSVTAAHLLAYQGRKLTGICPAYLTHDCPRLAYAFSLGLPRDLDIRGPILLAHSLASLSGGPLVLPGHQAASRAIDAGLRLAAGDLGAWCYGYANIRPGPFSGWLLAQGYATAEVAIDYVVTNSWTTTADYWAAMRSRRRQSLRGARQRSLAGGLQVTAEPPEPAAAITLIHQLLEAKGSPADLLPARFLEVVLRNLAPYERSILARDAEGTPRAVFTGWRFGDHQAMWLAGLAGDRSSPFEPYHAMLAELVETAIREGVRTIDLGRANGDIKRRYGARSAPLLLGLRSGRRDLDALLHLWCADLQRRNYAVLNGLETASRCC